MSILCEEHTGFIKHYSTTDHIFNLKCLIDMYLRCNKTLFCAFFFFNNVISFIQMLATINTPKVQAPFGVSLLHLVLIIQGYNQNYMKYIYNLNTISI